MHLHNKSCSLSPQEKQQPQSSSVVIINPGRHVQINQCLDLFCIAKSRASAVIIFKLACRKIQARDSIEGPRGDSIRTWCIAFVDTRIIYINNLR